MTQDDNAVPYQKLVDHFDRPAESPMERFDPDELPEGTPRELYDNIMAEYYSHIPAYPANSPKEKSKFDLINRARLNSDSLAQQGQGSSTNNPEILETTENKQLSRDEIKKIVGSYRGARPATRS